MSEQWPVQRADALVCINMIHITPWAACKGLMTGAERTLRSSGVLYLYGPYQINGRHTAQSNQEFDAWLRTQNAQWGGSLPDRGRSASGHDWPPTRFHRDATMGFVRPYSPAECIGAVKHRVEGNPDPKHVSTSFAERQNLNIRMGNRRMTRLTNAFSKKAANHEHMMAIYFMHYNFVRIHQTLKVTPAMAAGVTPKLWEMANMVKVLEDWEAAQK
jgi:hypothetical protein